MRQSLTTIDVFRLLSGFFCTIAGSVTAFPWIVDVPELLRDMTIANAGSILGVPSLLFAKFEYPATAVIGIVLVTMGLAFLTNRFVVLTAKVQIVFFVLSMTFIFRLMPETALACLPFVGIALWLVFGRREKTGDGAANTAPAAE